MIEITLDCLRPAPAHINSRKSESDIKSLAASIEQLGQLQPILIRPLDPSTNTFEIVDGHRRYAAMKELANGCSDAYTVTANVVHDIDDRTAAEMSLAANVVREQLHPVDEYEAFAELVRQGMAIKEIAKAFSIGSQQVKQRIALGSAIPEVRQAWKDNKINDSIFKSFANAPESRQREAWDECQREGIDGWRIERILSDKVISTKAPLAKWVDQKEYKKRGGTITSDLFGDDHVFEDKELFNTMADEAIAKRRNELLEDGWGDVIATRLDGEVIDYYSHRYQRLTPDHWVFESDEMAARNDALIEDGKLWEADRHRVENADPVYSPADKARGFVYIDQQGHEVRGLLDLKAAQKDSKSIAEVEEAPDNKGMSAALKAKLDAAYTAALATKIQISPAHADALMINAMIYNLGSQPWMQPIGLHGNGTSKQAAAYARALLDKLLVWDDKKVTLAKRLDRIMTMKPEDRDMLRAALVGAHLVGVNNQHEVAKVMKPDASYEWNDELKEAYFKSMKKEELSAFINEREPNLTRPEAKKGELVALAIKHCGDWMPEELR